MRGLVIIGGGAAGIGAALEARAMGIDALIVEAKDRLGGRARTIDWCGYRLDFGCTWLHSADRNSLRAEAERIGVPIDRRPTNWLDQYRDLGFSPAERRQAREAYDELEQRIRDNPPPSDRASDAVEPGNPWNGWLEALSGYINGAPLSQVSVADWLAYDNASTMQNARLPEGYGGLLEALSIGLERKLQTPVTAVSRRRNAVQIATEAGVIEAEKVIVTIPTPALAGIRFDPPIEGLADAAGQLPLGIADKLFLSLDHAEDFPVNTHLIGNSRSTATGSYTLRPMGMPVVEGFFGGDGARALEEMGDAGAEGFATDELAALIGSDIRSRLGFIAVSRWAHEPWIEGSYSHACPGHASARQHLAQAGDDRIAFAGEAVMAGDYSTAHGAYDSGRGAVRRLFGREELGT